jgi:hypothetical protein
MVMRECFGWMERGISDAAAAAAAAAATVIAVQKD